MDKHGSVFELLGQFLSGRPFLKALGKKVVELSADMGVGMESELKERDMPMPYKLRKNYKKRTR